MEFDRNRDHDCQGENCDHDHRHCDFIMCSFKVEIKRNLQQQLSKGFHKVLPSTNTKSCKAEFKGDLNWSQEYLSMETTPKE